MLSPLSHRLSLNWTADHFPFAFLVLVFCLAGFVCSVAVGVVFLFAVFLQWNRDGCWTMYRSHNEVSWSLQLSPGRLVQNISTLCGRSNQFGQNRPKPVCCVE